MQIQSFWHTCCISVSVHDLSSNWVCEWNEWLLLSLPQFYHLNISFLMNMCDATNIGSHIVYTWRLPVFLILISAYTIHTICFSLIFFNEVLWNCTTNHISFSACPLPDCGCYCYLLYEVLPVSQPYIIMCWPTWHTLYTFRMECKRYFHSFPWRAPMS